jgi:hypothetical protein
MSHDRRQADQKHRAQAGRPPMLTPVNPDQCSRRYRQEQAQRNLTPSNMNRHNFMKPRTFHAIKQHQIAASDLPECDGNLLP